MSIHSPVETGGVLYLSHAYPSSTTSLIVKSSLFYSCRTTKSSSGWYGGGAIYAGCGSLSVSLSSFIHCSTVFLGGAILAQYNSTSSVISESYFISCSANHGGGLMTHFGPASKVILCRFMTCYAEYVGGGLYHNSNLQTSSLSVTESLFTGNRADYTYDSTYKTQGGGAFEDFRAMSYTSRYSFLFFTGNAAPTGKGCDISIIWNALTQSSILYCFTTAASNSFWNNGSYVNSWLPQTNAIIKVFYSLTTVNYCSPTYLYSIEIIKAMITLFATSQIEKTLLS